MDVDDNGSPNRFRDFLEGPLRRPYHILVPLVVVVVAAVVLSAVLPKRYASSTLIRVESQKVPEAVARKTATEPARNALQTIEQQIMSRSRLETVIGELDPYPAAAGSRTVTDMVERMRGAISLAVEGNDSFSIEFVHTDPIVARDVANRLATLFIEEISESREAQVEGATELIDAQLQEAREALEEKEAAVRLLKKRYMGSLPEQLGANLSTAQRLQSEKQSVELAILNAADQLASLEQNAARTGVGVGSELSQLRSELAILQTRYTDVHPDVRRLQARIRRLEELLSEDGSEPPQRIDPAVQNARRELERLRARRADLESRIADLQRRIELAPRIEQEVAELTRDSETLRESYLALLAQKMDAPTAESLGRRWKGQHFRILAPANLPDSAFFPNRQRFVLVGSLLGLLLGVGLAVLAESLDSSIKSSRDLEALVPVLAAIPESRRPRSSRRSSPPTPSVARGSTRRAGPELLTDVVASGAPTLSYGRHRAEPTRSLAAVALDPQGERHWLPAFEELPDVTPRPAAYAFREALSGQSLLAEEFRVLRAKVKNLGQQQELRAIGLVSGMPGEGKTLVALGLANALAQEDPKRRVLIVEADLRRRSLVPALGLEPIEGLADWLEGAATEPLPIRRLGPRGPFVLSAGTKAPDDPEILGSSSLQAAFRASVQCFDFVLADCPPIGPVADPLILKDVLDGFLMVVRARFASQATVRRALSSLGRESVAGAVLNGYRELLRSRYR